jgi:hypothetical protein
MADRDKSEKADKVGYGKPPKHTQFQPGKSGNPKGRPKGSKNFATVIQDELERRVVVTEDGRRRKITKREAVAKQLVNRAAGGDPKAIPVLLNETRAYENDASAGGPQPITMAHEDELVLESIVRRIREAPRRPPPEPRSKTEDPSEFSSIEPSAGPTDGKQEGSK